MRLSAFSLLALFALCAGLSGCTLNPATGQPAFTGFMSESEESKIGKENYPKILEEFGGTHANPALQAYIQRIGKSVASLMNGADQVTAQGPGIAAPGKADQLDAGFQGTSASFRRLSASEAAAFRPKHVKIITAGKSDTLASLAQRMAFSDYREERLRALNGLQPGDTATPGQRVKIVIE